MLDLIVKDKDLETETQIIIDTVRTGEIGDGKIFIYDVESVIRIRTGEKDDDAI
jgi:nitrogen regulatory protein P-II 1